MGMLLLILQIIGAMPGIIDFARRIWDYINQVNDPKLRRFYRRRMRSIILRRRNIRTLSADDRHALQYELEDLWDEVSKTFDMENKEIRR